MKVCELNNHVFLQSPTLLLDRQRGCLWDVALVFRLLTSTVPLSCLAEHYSRNTKVAYASLAQARYIALSDTLATIINVYAYKNNYNGG